MSERIQTKPQDDPEIGDAYVRKKSILDRYCLSDNQERV